MDVIVVFLVAIYLAPIYWITLTSVKPMSDINSKKPVLFFPARFDLHEVQASDGYAYNVAVQRFNSDHKSRVGPFISTDAQGDWWGGAGGGTVAHASIACFFGDTAETMMAFAATCEPEIPRIALVDFNSRQPETSSTLD